MRKLYEKLKEISKQKRREQEFREQRIAYNRLKSNLRG